MNKEDKIKLITYFSDLFNKYECNPIKRTSFDIFLDIQNLLYLHNIEIPKNVNCDNVLFNNEAYPININIEGLISEDEYCELIMKYY